LLYTNFFLVKKGTCTRRLRSYQLLRRRRKRYSPTVSGPYSGTSVKNAE
jgi:hypothetical protein